MIHDFHISDEVRNRYHELLREEISKDRIDSSKITDEEFEFIARKFLENRGYTVSKK